MSFDIYPVMASMSLRLPEELRRRIDAARGAVPRERWIRQACEMRLQRKFASTMGRQPGPNVEHIRSSAQAKDDVKPIPKGKS